MDALRQRASTRRFVDPVVDARSPWFPEYEGRELEFAGDVLGLRHPRTKSVQMWAFQRYAFEAVFKYKKVAVYGCRGCGKDFFTGYLAPTFFYTEPSRVLTTAVGMRQVRNILWAEISGALDRATVPLQGRRLTTELRLDARHYMIGIPCKDPNAVRGWHAAPKMGGDPDADFLTPKDIEELAMSDLSGTRLLLIIDEPEGLSQEVFDILRGMFNKPNVYCLLIGNPMLGLDDEHEYVWSLTKDLGFHRIKVSAFPESKFSDPMSGQYDKVFDSVPKTLISSDAMETALRLYEPNDPVFLSDWLGQFSPGSVRQLVVTRSILTASVAYLMENKGTKLALGPRIGIDIGTGHPDPCTAALFFNGVLRATEEWRPERDDDAVRVSTAEWMANLMVKWGAMIGDAYPEEWDREDPITGPRVSVDDTANPGCCDILASKGVVNLDRVNFGAAADGQWPTLVGKFRFKNVRGEMHWVARRGLQEGVFCVNPEQFPVSARQAQWARFEREADGYGTTIIIEKKEKIIERHGHSPDHWDSAILGMRQTAPKVRARTLGGGKTRMPGSPRDRRRKGFGFPR